MPPGSALRFSVFELDFDSGELRKHGRVVKLARQPFLTLALLARSPGQLVSREVIRKELWGDDRIVDFENGLNFCIRRIRLALGDDPRKPRFIETLPRRGYRFIFKIPRQEGLPSSLHAARTSAKTQGSAVDAAAMPARPTIAVTDFVNLSGDPELDWLGTGLADTLTASARRRALVRLVSPQRVGAALRRLRGGSGTHQGIDRQALGTELGADWVVGGSYQCIAQRIRITALFSNISRGEDVPAGQLDGGWEELFELQDQLAADFVAALGLNAAPASVPHALIVEGRHLHAFEQYSRGRQALRLMDKQSLGAALKHYQRAIALAPDYAMAHAGAGATCAMRFIHRSDPNDLLCARTELEEAQRLDAELAQPYPWLCYLYMREGRFEEALRAGQRAVALLPELVQAHYFLGLAYFATCELQADNYAYAVSHLLQASRVEPEWQASWYVLSLIALLHGDYANAEQFAAYLKLPGAGSVGAIRFIGAEALQATLNLRRGSTERAVEWLAESTMRLSKSDHVYREGMMALTACLQGDVHLRLGSAERALTDYRQAWHLVQKFPTMLAQPRHGVRALAGLAAAYAALQDGERSDEVMWRATHMLEKASPPQMAAAGAGLAELHYALATARARRAETGQSLAHLECALKAGWRDANWLDRDPELDAVRREPRFQALTAYLRSLPPLELKPSATRRAAAPA
jgi:DNA-binding winged helix-turn-helix (wHTH) protein/tetratricopeptide (TPR) repeat protein